MLGISGCRLRRRRRAETPCSLVSAFWILAELGPARSARGAGRHRRAKKRPRPFPDAASGGRWSL